MLDNNSVESSVARGAAYYGRVRRGIGLRVGAGSARTYYIGLHTNDHLEGICVLPAGVNEGTTLPLLNREFSVLANRQVSFSLLSSRTRHDAHGEIVFLEESEVDHHPPLVTLLRYGSLRETSEANSGIKQPDTSGSNANSPLQRFRWGSGRCPVCGMNR